MGVNSDGSPTSSSAPSPTDGGGGKQSGGAGDDKRFPQPIGAGRSMKQKAPSNNPAMFPLGDAAANAGLWAFAAGEIKI